MCAVCLSSPCHTRCPNASEPKPVCRCGICKENIYPGDEYADVDGSIICEGCLEDMTPREVLQICGYHTWPAEEAS